MDPLGAITTSIELAVLVKATFDQVDQNKGEARRVSEEIVEALELMENLAKANCTDLDIPELRSSISEFESELRIILAQCMRKNKKHKGFSRFKSTIHNFFHANDIKDELSALERKIDKCYRRLQMAVSARIERRVAESNIRIENPAAILERHSDTTNALLLNIVEEQKKNSLRLEAFETRFHEALLPSRVGLSEAISRTSSPDVSLETPKKLHEELLPEAEILVDAEILSSSEKSSEEEHVINSIISDSPRKELDGNVSVVEAKAMASPETVQTTHASSGQTTPVISNALKLETKIAASERTHSLSVSAPENNGQSPKPRHSLPQSLLSTGLSHPSDKPLNGHQPSLTSVFIYPKPLKGTPLSTPFVIDISYLLSASNTVTNPLFQQDQAPQRQNQIRKRNSGSKRRRNRSRSPTAERGVLVTV